MAGSAAASDWEAIGGLQIVNVTLDTYNDTIDSFNDAAEAYPLFVLSQEIIPDGLLWIIFIVS